MSIHRFRAAAALSVLALSLAACGGGSDDSPSTGSTGDASAKPAKVEEVNYLTSFNTFGRDAYVYVAQEKGYFEEAGIKVDIKPGTGTVDVMKLIASGRADFGPGDFSAAVVTIAKEKLPVTTVAMIHQKSLAAIVSLEESGISSPADLAGKKVADQPGSTVQVIFPVYAKAAGIDPSKVTWVPSAPPALPQLLASGQVDAIGQFVVGRSLIEGAAGGRKAAFLPYGDVLPDLYGNGLMTSTELAEKNPELVKKFTEALLKGLEYSIAHPEETGEILKKYQPTQDAAVAAAEVEAMAPYVDAGGTQIGSIDRSRVEKVISIMEEAGAIDSGVTADQLVTFDNKDS